MSEARVDPLTPEQRSALMARVRSSNTRPELFARSAIHRAGFRFRLHNRHLPGSPDLVFPKYRLAVFVHGCFWHWHGCKRSRMPVTNRSYWMAKIERNIERDKAAREALSNLGWRVEVVWECDLKAGVERVIAILATLRRERISPAPRKKPSPCVPAPDH